MQGGSNGVPTYTPYSPRSSKRLPNQPSSSSTTSALSKAAAPSSERLLGFVRPSISTTLSESATILQPKATRPALPNHWSTSTRPPSQLRSSSNGVAGPSSPPPAIRTTRGTPPLSNNSLPFSSVPSGSSPFPPSSPQRNGSPKQQQQSPNYQPSSRAGTPKISGGERGRVAYHPSFQPQGVRRDRTDEFMSGRKSKGEGKKLEEGRLGRRMEKLIALHFPPPNSTPSTTIPALSRSSTLSSLTDYGASLRGKSALDLWRSVSGNHKDIEKSEQAIVKWQDDAEITRCPICMAAFGLKTRRHHCRLCGRVVCFLPPTPPSSFLPSPSSPSIPTPTRRERCSTFITHSYRDGARAGEEKELVGLTEEIETFEQDISFGGITGDAGNEKEKDERKKVRVCRDCLGVVMRQQAQILPPVRPPWLKAYEVLVQLEKEIEDMLPEFQELVLGIQNPAASLSTHHPPSALAAKKLRKDLLSNLASYDTLSKRISLLPLSPTSLPSGSQDRLQRAIAQRGTLFLTEKLGLLRTLGNIDEEAEGKKKKMKKEEEEKRGGIKTLKSLMSGEDEKAGSEKEGMLAVLLEQESLVRGYLEDANHRRQFEDAQSLTASLDELKLEIARLRA